MGCVLGISRENCRSLVIPNTTCQSITSVHEILLKNQVFLEFILGRSTDHQTIIFNTNGTFLYDSKGN